MIKRLDQGKIQAKYKGPYQITSTYPWNLYQLINVQSNKTLTKLIHRNRLTPYYDPIHQTQRAPGRERRQQAAPAPAPPVIHIPQQNDMRSDTSANSPLIVDIQKCTNYKSERWYKVKFQGKPGYHTSTDVNLYSQD